MLLQHDRNMAGTAIFVASLHLSSGRASRRVQVTNERLVSFISIPGKVMEPTAAISGAKSSWQPCPASSLRGGHGSSCLSAWVPVVTQFKMFLCLRIVLKSENYYGLFCIEWQVRGIMKSVKDYKQKEEILTRCQYQTRQAYSSWCKKCYSIVWNIWIVWNCLKHSIPRWISQQHVTSCIRIENTAITKIMEGGWMTKEWGKKPHWVRF